MTDLDPIAVMSLGFDGIAFADFAANAAARMSRQWALWVFG